MLRFLWRLLVVGFPPKPPKHRHEWETIKTTTKTKTYIPTNASHETLIYVQRCKGCGEIKQTEIG